MGSKNRQPSATIKELLISSGSKFSFTQAYRLVNLILKETKFSTNDIHNVLKIRPHLSLDFPCSDIHSIKNHTDENNVFTYQITTTFLGLYGSSSPLPTFYTENLLREQSEDSSLTRNFIDIFNNHLYHNLFKTWSSHKLSYKLFEEKDNNYLSYLYSIGGLDSKSTRDIIPEDYNPIRYLGILGHFPRSAFGLKTILADILEIPKINIFECKDTVIKISETQRLSLGLNNTELGESTHLGEQIISTTHAFTIEIGPIEFDTYTNILPNTSKFSLLNRIVNLYIDQPLIWDIEAIVISRQIPGIQLGADKGARLGFDSWIFNKSAPKKIIYKVNFKPAETNYL